MKKKLSNKTFFYHNQPYTAAAPLEGDEMMRPASPKAELWSAAHKVSPTAVAVCHGNQPKTSFKKTLIINYLSTNVMLKKNESFQKNTRLRLDL